MALTSRRFLSILATAAVSATGLAHAQSAALGNIAGVVRDSSGAIVSGVAVVVTNTQTGAVRNVKTDSAGHYEATFLQPGIYEVVIGGGSFSKLDQKNVNVQVGDTRTVDAALSAAAVDTVVTVTSEAPLLDTEKVASSQTVSEQLVANLPVNGRRFDNFVLLTPNVVPDGNTGLLAFRGISGIYNSNLVDGANNNQAFFSEARGRSIGAPYVYPIDAVKEFSAESAAYSAEFGQAAGGIINAVTKAGGNQLHGDVYEYYRTPGYNAIDRQTKTKPVKVQHQFGVSVGGPIIKDKLFFHFTYDGYRKVTPITYISTYNTATQSVADLAGLCDQRTSGYLTRGSGTTQAIYPSIIPGISPTQCAAAVTFINTTQLGAYPRNVKQDIYFPRLDFQLTPRTHLSATYLFENFTQPDGYNTSTTVNNGGVSQNGTANFHERFLVVNAETAIGAHSANVVHTQYSRDLETDGTNTGGPANSVTGLVSYGETSALPRGAFPDEHRIQITDIFSTTLGRHSIKLGADANIIHEQIQNLFQGNGQFNYGTGTTEFNFANWIQDVYQQNGGRHYNSFTQVNDPITHTGADDFYNQDLDGFLEDAWKATPTILISAGVRYDVQLVPQPEKPNVSSPVAQLYTSTINNYKGMFQPRIGFAWNPHEGTVVRGGYGIFYGLNSNSTYYTQRRENGVYQQQYNVSALTTPNSPYAPLTGTAAGAPNRAFQQSGTYAANAPQGGIPEFTPPGPAPTNQVTGAPNPAVSTNLSLASVSARGLDPNFQNPKSQSFDLTVEQQLPLHSTLTVAYVGNLASRLPIFVETNIDPTQAVNRTYAFLPGPGQGTPANIVLPYYGARLSTNTGSVLTGFSDVNANYNSLVFTVRKPFAHGLEVLANFTWSKNMDGGQVSGVNGTFNGTDTPIDPVARGRYAGRSSEYAKSDLDERTRTVVSVLAAPTVDRFISYKAARYFLDGFQMSATMTAQDGQPLTGFLGAGPASAIGDGGLTGAELSLFNSGTNGRVPTQIAARNSFKGPGVHNIDSRVSRTFILHDRYRIELFAEAFNVLNHKNVLGVNTTLFNFANPGSGVCPATGNNGCIVPNSASTAAFGSQNSTSSVLYGPRQVQLTGRFNF